MTHHFLLDNQANSSLFPHIPAFSDILKFSKSVGTLQFYNNLHNIHHTVLVALYILLTINTDAEMATV